MPHRNGPRTEMDDPKIIYENYYYRCFFNVEIIPPKNYKFWAV